MCVTEDGLIILLARIEKLAVERDRAATANGSLVCRHEEVLQTLDVAQSGNRRRIRDFDEAVKKIGEWAEYASQLRSAIDALDPPARRRKKIVLPDMPKPLETDIPF